MHPFSVVRGVQLRSLLPAATGVFFLGADAGSFLPLILLGGALVVAVVRVLDWQRHTYELTGDRVVERSGIISRTERTLELARIQQVDVQRNILDRMVGTAELRLETAADAGESEITLSVVTLEEADRLHARLGVAVGAAHAPAPVAHDGATPPPPATPEQEERTLLTVPLHHVALASVTGARLLLIPAGLAVLLGSLDDVGLFREAGDAAGDLTVRLGLAGAAVLLLVGGVLALAATAVAGVLRDGNWMLARRGDALRVRRGLTTERTATVPMNRVQKVTVDRSWLRGLLGFASVTIHSAGGVGGGGSANEQLDRQLTVPLLPEAAVAALVDELLAIDADARPELHPHPPRARLRAMVRGVLASLPVAFGATATGVTLLTQDVRAGLILPVLAVLSLVVGALVGLRRHAQRATGTSPLIVVHRTGLFGTSTAYTPRRKVQGVATRSSPFQRRRDLATVAIRVAGPSGGVQLVDLDARQAARLRDTLVVDGTGRTVDVLHG